ncbi:amidophosphoribosyltransferase [Bacteroidota bacterium]|nr:amidophosphoribosyltransferase [Bacteroidota bacterium]
MSDAIKHECGVALIRLRKPFTFYQEKYGSAFYGIEKMRLLLQKQRNRGQDGAGLATIKLDPKPGEKYISRKRSVATNYLDDLFDQVYYHFNKLKDYQQDAQWLKDNKPYMGELLLGHLRYGTHSDNSIETCHPFLRQNNWISRNLLLAGNFNLTNVDELFQELVELGQYPKEKSDTVTVLEKIGHFLDDEVQRLHTWYKPDGHSNIQINDLIYENLDIQRLLRRACKKFDGGYVMAGLIGHGDAFVIRDPAGIRPAFYYADEEIVVVASERPAIQTSMEVNFNDIKEVKPGHVLIIRKNGSLEELPFIEPREITPCSFERIYFSRGNDRDIYLERKALGKKLIPQILESIEYDFENTVFSFVPNTAETAFFGMIEGIYDSLNVVKTKKIQALMENGPVDDVELQKIMNLKPRIEKLILKDAKIRTFIADSQTRGKLVSHVYDITYGLVKNDVDTLVLLDDSIVRGTTLRDSIIHIASTLKPKKIIIASTAPQIRFPDCYGIDMSKMGEFVAFKALVKLLEENNKMNLLQETYLKCKEVEFSSAALAENQVSSLYESFSYQEISDKIAEIVTPPDTNIDIEVIYQTIADLHEACPNHKGDWYFSGKYPTPGGGRVANRAFINYMEKKDVRAY